VGAEVDAFLSDGERVTPALAIANRHAYTHTALMELLNQARLRGGVLARSQFAWLKLVDRPLWYALHSLGFETEGGGRYCHPNPRVEAVGARDHWAVERLAGEPVIEPNMDRAIEALRKVSAAARPERERSRSQMHHRRKNPRGAFRAHRTFGAMPAPSQTRREGAASTAGKRLKSTHNFGVVAKRATRCYRKLVLNCVEIRYCV
jgi:hypothetical protein